MSILFYLLFSNYKIFTKHSNTYLIKNLYIFCMHEDEVEKYHLLHLKKKTINRAQKIQKKKINTKINTDNCCTVDIYIY